MLACGQRLRTSAAHLQTAAEFKVGRLGRGRSFLSPIKTRIGGLYSATAAFAKLVSGDCVCVGVCVCLCVCVCVLVCVCVCLSTWEYWKQFLIHVLS